MGFYEELQLNAAGSKALIRGTEDKREKRKHIAVYIFKVVLTLAFCMAFIIAYTVLFGEANSIVGVVALLSVIVFRKADLGIKASQSAFLILAIFGVLAIGPRLANAVGPGAGLLVDAVSLLIITVFGCYDVRMSNQSTLVLGYLLLKGYDVTGADYGLRLLGLFAGAAATSFIIYWDHRKISYEKGVGDIVREFDIRLPRTRWQLCYSIGISTAMFLAELLGIPRTMWVGTAIMSVMTPDRAELPRRAALRIPGTILGGAIFFVLYCFLPEELRSMIGVFGGLCIGFSAAYGWQVVFNSFGAMSICVGMFGLTGSILLRIGTNIFGIVYGFVFEKLFHGAVAIAVDRGDDENVFIDPA